MVCQDGVGPRHRHRSSGRQFVAGVVVVDSTDEFLGETGLTGRVEPYLRSKAATVHVGVAQSHRLFDVHADDALAEQGGVHRIERRREFGDMRSGGAEVRAPTRNCGADPW